MIAELKRCSTASAVPIQVVKHLPDVVVVSGAKHPPAPDEHGALAKMLISWHLIVAFFQPDPLNAIGGGGIRDGAIVTKDMSLLVRENGHVCLACQVRNIVPCGWISDAGQGDLIVIAVQQDALWQLHPEVCDGVLGIQRFAGIAWQREDHGAVRSTCWSRHLWVL